MEYVIAVSVALVMAVAMCGLVLQNLGLVRLIREQSRMIGTMRLGGQSERAGYVAMRQLGNVRPEAVPMEPPPAPTPTPDDVMLSGNLSD